MKNALWILALVAVVALGLFAALAVPTPTADAAVYVSSAELAEQTQASLDGLIGPQAAVESQCDGGIPASSRDECRALCGGFGAYIAVTGCCYCAC